MHRLALRCFEYHGLAINSKHKKLAVLELVIYRQKRSLLRRSDKVIPRCWYKFSEECSLRLLCCFLSFHVSSICVIGAYAFNSLVVSVGVLEAEALFL